MLLTNGDNDPWVPLSRSRETERALAESGARVSMQVYPGRPHTISADELVRVRALLDEAAGAP